MRVCLCIQMSRNMSSDNESKQLLPPVEALSHRITIQPSSIQSAGSPSACVGLVVGALRQGQIMVQLACMLTHLRNSAYG